MTSASISWPQLMVLMAFGDETPHSVAGVVSVRDVAPLAEDDFAYPEPGANVVDHQAAWM
ncbi:MAG: hypothetical protein ABI808_05500 [Pseudonocardiales bacterium]